MLNKYLWQQRDNGGQWIVIDPRDTATARQGDLHLQLKPGTDVAVANGMLNVIIQRRADRRRFHPNPHQRLGCDKVRRLQNIRPTSHRRSRACRRKRSSQAALLYGRAKTGMVMHARGIEHHSNGVDNVLSYINLVLATGKIGAPGPWLRNDHRPGQRPGRPRARTKGRSTSGPAFDQRPGTPQIRLRGLGPAAEAELPQAGVSVVEMFQKMREGEIRGFISICNNVMVSLPDINSVRQSLEGLEFNVNIDFFMSESSRYADVVLPGTSWAEDEGVTANSEGRVVKINKAIDPPGEAQNGLVDHPGDRPNGWAAESISLSISRARSSTSFASRRKAARPITTALRTKRSNGNNGVFWPCPTEESTGTPRLFEEKFYHPDGKAKFHPIEYKGPNEVPDDRVPADPDQRPRRLSISLGQSDAADRVSRPAVPGALCRDPSGDRDETEDQRRRAREGCFASRRRRFSGSGRARRSARTRYSSRITGANSLR